MLTSLFAAGSRRADRNWPLDGEHPAIVLRTRLLSNSGAESLHASLSPCRDGHCAELTPLLGCRTASEHAWAITGHEPAIEVRPVPCFHFPAAPVSVSYPAVCLESALVGARSK